MVSEVAAAVVSPPEHLVDEYNRDLVDLKSARGHNAGH